MAAKQANKADDNESSYIPYSLPRLITPAVQCSFCAYFWELYTTEFGWSMAEYGIVSRTCTGAQFFSFIVIGIICCFAIDKPSDTANENQAKIQGKLNPTKWVEVCGTFIHWLTYFLLIFLPIKWHGVKTPYVDSIFGKTSSFWLMLFNGPIRSSNNLSLPAGIFIHLISIPLRILWMILYILIKICFLCIVNFGAILTLINYPIRLLRRRKIPPLLETLQDPTCLACCNTTCCNNFAMRMNHFGRWFGTRTFFIYFLVTAHGVGVSAHELSNKIQATYIYPEKKRGNNELMLNLITLDKLDANDDKRGTLNIINLAFFFIAQLIIISLFSIVKFYVRSRAIFADTFVIISILFLLIQPPILWYFYTKTQYTFNDQADQRTADGSATGPSIYNDSANRTVGNSDRTQIAATNSNDLEAVNRDASDLWKDCFKIVCLTILHGTILFWMFSGGPLTFYISFFVLGGHVGIGSFGVLIFNVSLTVTSWLFTGIAMIGGAGFLFHPNTQKSIAFMCVVCEFLVYYVFNAHDYLILVVIGAVNSVFVGYVNIMLDGVVKTQNIKKYKWIAYGGFYSVTNLILTPAMEIMFKSMDHDELKHVALRCIRFDYHYCFPTVYKTITGVFICLNALVFIPILLL